MSPNDLIKSLGYYEITADADDENTISDEIERRKIFVSVGTRLMNRFKELQKLRKSGEISEAQYRKLFEELRSEIKPAFDSAIKDSANLPDALD